METPCVIFGTLAGTHQPMEDEYLTKCVVDPVKRTFYLYSNEGQKKSIECDNFQGYLLNYLS